MPSEISQIVQKQAKMAQLGHVYPSKANNNELSMNDKIASMHQGNIMGIISERQMGFNKKRFFPVKDIRALQTKIQLNLV